MGKYNSIFYSNGKKNSDSSFNPLHFITVIFRWTIHNRKYPTKPPIREKNKRKITQVKLTAQQIGIFSQSDGTLPIDKMNFNQWVDDAAKKIEAPQVVNFAEWAQQDHLQAYFSQLQWPYTEYFNKLFINSKNPHFDWCDLIMRIFLENSFIGIFASL